MLKFANITRRIQMPDDMRFAKGVQVNLMYRRVPRASDTDKTDIELCFFISNKEKFLRLETDDTLTQSDLPNLAINKKRWEKVRQLCLDGWAPYEACDAIALEIYMRGLRFSFDAADDSVDGEAHFYAQTRNWVAVIHASVDPKKIGPFLTDASQPQDPNPLDNWIKEAKHSLYP